LLAPCCCWFSCVPGVPAEDKVSAVAAVPTAVDVLSAFGVSYVPGVLSVVGVPAFAIIPIRLASPDVLIVYCTAVSLFCLFTDSSFCYLYPAVLAVASILLLTSLILLMFPPVMASLMLLYVPVVSCAAVGPAVYGFLALFFRPWSPSYG
jgi:hypothetical protein